MKDLKFAFKISDLSYKEFFRENGFVVIKNIFSKNFLDQLKKEFYKDGFQNNYYRLPDQKFAKVLPCAGHINKKYSDLLSNKKIIEVLRNILQSDNIIFTSHSSMQLNMSSDWHKDDGGGIYFNHEKNYFKNNSIKLVKLGIYLFDTKNNDGLSVRIGSHRNKNLFFGDELYLDCNYGDVIFFDPRISHKGDAKQSILFKIKRFLGFKLIDYERLACFFTFGANNKYTKIYSETNMERQTKQLGTEKYKKAPKYLKNKLKKLDVETYF